MKHLKRFNESIKNEIISHLSEKEGDIDSEEIQNVFDILNEYDDDLTGLTSIDSKLISRLLDDKRIISRIEVDDSFRDPFEF